MRIIFKIGGYFLLFHLLLGLWGCSFLGCKPEVTIKKDWSYVTPDALQFVQATLTPDGKILTSTRNGDVYTIDSSGTGARLYEGKTVPPLPFIDINPMGNTFGVLINNQFILYDAAGNKLGVQPVSPGMFKQVPNSQLVYSPEVEGDPENMHVSKIRILDATGAVKWAFPAKGLKFSRLTATHIIYSTGLELVKSTFQGVHVWSTPVKVRKFEIAKNGDQLIVNDAEDSAKIYHYNGASRIETDSLKAPVWNLAMSPGGQYSAASTQTKLHVYLDGKRQSQVSLPVTYTVSLDINDKGETLVGGQDSDFTSHVLMYDASGYLLWEEKSVSDNNAWQPGVHFNPDGDSFVIRFKDGLKYYTITGRQ
jgi:hypothetical protein